MLAFELENIMQTRIKTASYHHAGLFVLRKEYEKERIQMLLLALTELKLELIAKLEFHLYVIMEN